MESVSGVIPVRRALLSVSDKEGLAELAGALAELGAELLASGGTRAALELAGLASREVSDYTGQAEILGGRVKTLHPKIHGGILARRDVKGDVETLERSGIGPIDLVVTNLYPFEEHRRAGVSTDPEMIEQIDIGGVALIRAAAKNHEWVGVVVDPGQYRELIGMLRSRGGLTREWRRRAARLAFQRTARYDTEIAEYFLGTEATATRGDAENSDLNGGPFPRELDLRFTRRGKLRYGENPHQRGALYAEEGAGRVASVLTARKLHGKELSFNNLLDADAALRVLRNFDAGRPTGVILKHNNPCGAAIGGSMAEAFELSYEGDPVSAFGGIVGLNGVVDAETAERMCVPGRFLEVIVAGGFTEDAIGILTTRPSWRNSVRLLDLGRPIGSGTEEAPGFSYQRILGGLLVQDWDEVAEISGEVVTRRAPDEGERAALDFAWRVCQMVRSNAIALARGTQLVGVGAGQMSRLDSVEIAVSKAGERARGAVMASDAFFPFRDGPDVAARAGVTAIVQPGGSRRDDEVIGACNEQDLAMIFTHKRHFRH